MRAPDDHFVLPGNRWDLMSGIEPDEPPTVAVIIAYFDAQAQLDRILAALAVQSYPFDRLEVIVADDGSPEAPRLNFSEDLDVRLVRQPDFGFRAGAARNLGARSARSEILVFLDVDTVPEPLYLQEMVRLPALTPDALVTGRRRHADFSGWDAERTVRWLSSERDGDGPTELTEPRWLRDEHRRTADLLHLDQLSYRFVISAVLGCSRALFQELGGFEESLTQYGGEDWELAHRALCAGAVLAHVPGAVAWHDGPDWGERGDEESRRRQKAEETKALARLIPSTYPAGRAGEAATGRPAVVGELIIGSADDAAVVIAVHSVLRSGLDIIVWLQGARAELLRRRHFAPNQLIRSGPIDPKLRASARIHVTLSRPLRVEQSAWPALLRPVEHGDVGEVIVRDRGAEMIVAATGAQARVARWARLLPACDLMRELFGRQVLDGSAVGVSTIPDQKG